MVAAGELLRGDRIEAIIRNEIPQAFAALLAQTGFRESIRNLRA